MTARDIGFRPWIWLDDEQRHNRPQAKVLVYRAVVVHQQLVL